MDTKPLRMPCHRFPFDFGSADPLTGDFSLDREKTPFALIRFFMMAEDEFGGRLGQYSPNAYITIPATAGIPPDGRSDFPATPNWGIELPDGINGYTAVNDGYHGPSRSVSGVRNLPLYDIPLRPFALDCSTAARRCLDLCDRTDVHDRELLCVSLRPERSDDKSFSNRFSRDMSYYAKRRTLGPIFLFDGDRW